MKDQMTGHEIKSVICNDKYKIAGQSLYIYANRRSAMRIGVRHIGQPRSNDATVSAQLPQNRERPHGTRATPSRGCSRQTSHELEVSAEAATLSTPSACEGVALSVSASSATSLSAGSDSSELWSGICRGWACTMLWLTCLLYTSPSPRDGLLSRMPSSA